MFSERSAAQAPSSRRSPVRPLRHGQRTSHWRIRTLEGAQQEETLKKLSPPVAPCAPLPRWTALDRMVVGLLVLCMLGVGVFSVSLGWISPGARSTPGSSAQANNGAVSPFLTVTPLPQSSIPESPTSTPAASPSPAPPLLRFGVTPSSMVDQCDSHKATLLPHPLFLENMGSTVSVTWQIQISDTSHSGHLWATASPASGSIAAGQQATVVLAPTSKVCQHAKGKITYQAILTYQGAGLRGAILITDLVVVP